jgi:hypothetical protein
VEDKQVAVEKAAREKAALEQTTPEQKILEQGTVATEHEDDTAGNQQQGISRRRRKIAPAPGLWLLCVFSKGSSSVGA